MKKRVIFIGVDQMIPGLVDKFMSEGMMPSLSRLADKGVKTVAYSCPPCDTPTNWTSIATGATTGIHKCASFYPHAVGEEFGVGLTQRSRSMLSRFCDAEYIWDVLDKEGLTSFIINYPSGWPSDLKNGVISTYTWNIPESRKRIIKKGKKMKFEYSEVSDPELLKNLNSNKIPLKITLQVKDFKSPLEVYIVGNEHYDALCYMDNDSFITTKKDQWSDFIKAKSADDDGFDCLYKIKFLDVDIDKKKGSIEFSSIYSLSDWVRPQKYAEGLIRNALSEDVQYSSDVEYMIDGKIDDFLVEANEECNGIVKALAYMKKEIDWDFAIFHVHFLDTVNHYSLAYLYEESPLRELHPENILKSKENVETAYKIIDKMLGEILDEIVDEQTSVILMADHGAIPVWKTVNLTRVFAESGLIKYTKESDKYMVNWKETKAFPYYEPHYVYVNLKGRDPQGIVTEEDYEKVCDEIVQLLENLIDPETNEKIMRCVFKKRDSAFLGQNGKHSGDIIYFLNAPYQLFDGSTAELNATEVSEFSMSQPIVKMSEVCFGAHAYYLPTTKVGIFSVSVPLIMSGPEIDSKKSLLEPVYTIDIAPTIARIFSVPRPKQSQGRVLHEIFK